jgi:ketosteroid isomerase-like protein
MPRQGSDDPVTRRPANAPAPAGLTQHEATRRAEALLRERARLLRETRKKQRQLDEVRLRADRDAHEVLSKTAPLIERHRQLRSQLAVLFDQLLAESHGSTRARRRLLGIRSSLELQGLLSPQSDDTGASEHPRERQPEPTSAKRRHRVHLGSRPPEVAGARQVGQERRSLKELFRSLARAVHPDQARHDADRVRRTEVMKDVTRAYEDGDLARLLELEDTWQIERPPVEGSDPVLGCRELERVNRELLQQIRELTRRLRDAKREAREASHGVPPDEVVERAGRELDELQVVHDFLCRFRDGKLTLSELSRGPSAAGFVTSQGRRPRSRTRA